MMSQIPEHYPITGLCVVADPSKCPPGYALIFHSHDKQDDCDLWKDSFFKARVTRYLCITRKFPLDGGKLNNVLADVVIQNERDIPPSGYSLIEKTLDTGEKASRKKQICVKMLPRPSTSDAINSLIVLSKSKRAPPSFTLSGEINGLLICFKMGVVPPETQSPVAATVTPIAASPQSLTQAPAIPPRPSVDLNQGQSDPTYSTIARYMNAMTGVPFQVHPQLKPNNSLGNASVPEVQYRSLVDIENEFSYPFRIERSTSIRTS